MKKKTVLWICGKAIKGKNKWEFQGIFSSEQKAISACRNKMYFIGEVILDEELPDETIEWKGAYYPLDKK